MSFNFSDIITKMCCLELGEIRKTTTPSYSTSAQHPFTMSTVEHVFPRVTVTYHLNVQGELEMWTLITPEGQAVKGVGLRSREKFLYFLV